MQTKVSIILLAAGLSRRMGTANKLLLPFKGTTLVEYTADKLLPLNATEIIVVTGHEAPLIHHRLHDRPFRFTYNRDYDSGMTSSIQQGISACHPESKGAMICLSDMPYLEVEDIEQVWAKANGLIIHEEKVIVAPFLGQRMGNPVFFSKYYFPEILSHKEPNGCRSLIKKEQKFLVKVPLNNKIAFEDIDTPKDWNRI